MSTDIRRAQLTVASHSRTPDECRELLDMLGLLTAERRKPGRPAVDHGHGHRRTYDKGCRCADCREAHRLYFAKQRAKWAKDPSAADRAGHGKPSTYKNYSCRCEPCTREHSAYLAAGRDRRRQRAAASLTGGAK
jgi:hypothetical protein